MSLNTLTLWPREGDSMSAIRHTLTHSTLTQFPVGGAGLRVYCVFFLPIVIFARVEMVASNGNCARARE